MGVNQKDKELQKRLRANEKEALEFVYAEYRTDFLNYFKRYDITHINALDVYQDAIIAMRRNFVTSQLELKSSSVKTYLFGIGKNIVLKKIEKESRAAQLLEQEKETVMEIEEIYPSERSILLSKNLEKISESCRNILKLYYYRNLTIKEIVELTDYKDENTVRSHKSRCLKGLKSLFNVHG